MSRPAPYIICTTKVAMDAAIRACYAAGFVYHGSSAQWLMGCVPDDESVKRYPCLTYDRVDHLAPQSRASLVVGNGVRCNSVNHMIRYLRTNGKT